MLGHAGPRRRTNPSLSPQSTKAVYDRILDLRIATPQIVINYAMFLEEHKYFEESFKVSAWLCGRVREPGLTSQGAGGRKA